jgi:hypothetical protein
MTETLLKKLDNLAENANALDGWAHLNTDEIVQLLRMVRDTADSALTDAVAQARHEGMSWDAVGRWLGTSRQAAQQRYGS